MAMNGKKGKGWPAKLSPNDAGGKGGKAPPGWPATPSSNDGGGKGGKAPHVADAARQQLQQGKNEYETVQHFQKCYLVLQEIFKEFGNFEGLLPECFKFLDLGCAPGGFSAFLLDDGRCSQGFGVSLPAIKGGFPMRLRSDAFLLQSADLFEIEPRDLIVSEVNFCVCDAHYLRNSISSYERYRGVRCRTRQHGVWGLLMKEFWLGFSKMLPGAILIFRFGWHDRGENDEGTAWYRNITLRLFAMLHDLFDSVQELKSDTFNVKNNSFYVTCSGFNAERFQERGYFKILGSAFRYLMQSTSDDPKDLNLLVQIDSLADVRTPEVDKKTTLLLDRIHEVHKDIREKRWAAETQPREPPDPNAVVYMAPAPAQMTAAQLHEKFKVFGWVLNIDISEHSDYVAVRYGDLRQAREACAALRHSAKGAQVWTQEEAAYGGDGWHSEDWFANTNILPHQAGNGAWFNPDGTPGIISPSQANSQASPHGNGTYPYNRPAQGNQASNVTTQNGYAASTTDAETGSHNGKNGKTGMSFQQKSGKGGKNGKAVKDGKGAKGGKFVKLEPRSSG